MNENLDLLLECGYTKPVCNIDVNDKSIITSNKTFSLKIVKM